MVQCHGTTIVQYHGTTILKYHGTTMVQYQGTTMVKYHGTTMVKCCYHGNDDSAHTKNNWGLCFTITQIQTKFEDDPIRIAAGRALTIKSLRRQRRDSVRGMQ